MSKPYTELGLSTIFDEDLIWRRRELSDIKTAVRTADSVAKPGLLRAIVTMSYAHWEGYVRNCANRYFEFLALRNKQYATLERQIYVNSFLVRLDAMSRGRVGIEARCKLVNDILDGTAGSFRYVNPTLIDTRSNLTTDTLKEICIVCALDFAHFETKRTFLDLFVVKRRNAIAHGQQEFIEEGDVDNLVAEVLALMQHFRTLLENKVYLKQYAAA